ncbi:hypothetical protein Afil01_27220 [Actinorhabdospora filicis]|uniref:Clp R domain-containing protein n=1 Tax=Actinorhabdospora filicis TaxID=1785913 RepID=A0A9W6WAR3_9ACTN|nr:Clp protease N-terminal domain-containing protein [Actinorhabdospora filicis]GLZ77915.1 hypothetical protein Afil01_27220 [Actinorhabdospora filicis]
MFGTEKNPFAVIVKASAEESRRRGDRRIGTEHLLLGILAAADRPTRPAVTGLLPGIDLAAARAALSDMDAAALRAIGLDIDPAPVAARPRRHPAVPGTALTTSARAAVKTAVRSTTLKDRKERIAASLLVALLEQPHPDPVADLFERLGVDREETLARLTR